jgi:hypothetical protein
MQDTIVMENRDPFHLNKSALPKRLIGNSETYALDENFDDTPSPLVPRSASTRALKRSKS